MIPVQPYPSLKGSCLAYVLVTHTMVHTDIPARCPALLSSFTTLGQIYTLIFLCFLPPSWRSPGTTAFFSVMERSGNSPFALLPAVLMDPSVPGAVFHLLLPYHKRLNMVSTHMCSHCCFCSSLSQHKAVSGYISYTLAAPLFLAILCGR